MFAVVDTEDIWLPRKVHNHDTVRNGGRSRIHLLYEYEIRIPLFWKYIHEMAMKRKFYYVCSWKPKLWLLPLAFRLPNYDIYIYITSLIETSRLMLIKIK